MIRAGLQALFVVGDSQQMSFGEILQRLCCRPTSWKLTGAPPWQGREFDIVVIGLSNGPLAFSELTELRRQRPSAPTLVLVPASADPSLLRAAAESADDFAIWPGRTGELDERIRRLSRTNDDPGRIEATTRRLTRQLALGELIGKSREFCRLVDVIPRFAASDATLLILGETGTGKELCARALHQLSERAAAPFVTVDCGALPDQLLENELFGHARGAFTDARFEQRGLVALAEHGTLFLDEVDALSSAAQAKLLRLLEERSYRALGSDRFVHADVRVLAATNADLKAMVEQRKFRADLYHRLNVLRVELPALRQRGEDVSLLAEHFARKLGSSPAERGVGFSAAALAKLRAYAWPGNVRELQNVVRRALLALPPGQLEIQDFELDVAVPTLGATTAGRNFREARAKAVAAFERSFLSELLDEHHGNITRAARAVGKDRRALGRLIKKHGIGRTGS